jgi:hypothetical protein
LWNLIPFRPTGEVTYSKEAESVQQHRLIIESFLPSTVKGTLAIWPVLHRSWISEGNEYEED